MAGEQLAAALAQAPGLHLQAGLGAYQMANQHKALALQQREQIIGNILQGLGMAANIDQGQQRIDQGNKQLGMQQESHDYNMDVQKRIDAAFPPEQAAAIKRRLGMAQVGMAEEGQRQAVIDTGIKKATTGDVIEQSGQRTTMNQQAIQAGARNNRIGDATEQATIEATNLQPALIQSRIDQNEAALAMAQAKATGAPPTPESITKFVEGRRDAVWADYAQTVAAIGDRFDLGDPEKDRLIAEALAATQERVKKLNALIDSGHFSADKFVPGYDPYQDYLDQMAGEGVEGGSADDDLADAIGG